MRTDQSEHNILIDYVVNASLFFVDIGLKVMLTTPVLLEKHVTSLNVCRHCNPILVGGEGG